MSETAKHIREEEEFVAWKARREERRRAVAEIIANFEPKDRAQVEAIRKRTERIDEEECGVRVRRAFQRFDSLVGPLD